MKRRRLLGEQLESRSCPSALLPGLETGEGEKPDVTIDIGFLYSADAEAHIKARGSTVAAYVREQVAATNGILDASGVDAVFEAMFIRQDDRPETESTTIEEILSEVADGVVENALRDKYGVDVMVYLFGPMPSVCGATFGPLKYNQPYDLNAATSAVMPYCNSDTNVFPHEVGGHFLGANHLDREIGQLEKDNLLTDYGRAWEATINGGHVATIMQSDTSVGTTVPLFSSPDLTWTFSNGLTLPIGSEYQNNVKAMNEFAETPSAYRDRQAVLHNVGLPLDVNDDGHVTPLDALIVINRLNAAEGPTSLLTMTEADVESLEGLGYFPDTSGDREITPLDVLLIINEQNRDPEGEQISLRTAAVDIESIAAVDLTICI